MSGPIRQCNCGRSTSASDYGACLEILGGVSTQDQVVINPPDSLEQGQRGECRRGIKTGQGPVSPRTAAGNSADRRENAPFGKTRTRQGPAARRERAVKGIFSWAVLLLRGLQHGCTVGPRYAGQPRPRRRPMRGRRSRRGSRPLQKTRSRRARGGQVFHDATLEWLRAATPSGKSVSGRGARSSDQARSLARVATAAYFPQVSTDPSYVRERGSGNRPLNGFRPIGQPVRFPLTRRRLYDSVFGELRSGSVWTRAAQC